MARNGKNVGIGATHSNIVNIPFMSNVKTVNNKTVQIDSVKLRCDEALKVRKGLLGVSFYNLSQFTLIYIK